MEVRYHPENCDCLECRIGRVTAERDRYKEAMERIADIDPDDLQIFHTIANEALKDA